MSIHVIGPGRCRGSSDHTTRPVTEIHQSHQHFLVGTQSLPAAAHGASRRVVLGQLGITHLGHQAFPTAGP